MVAFCPPLCPIFGCGPITLFINLVTYCFRDCNGHIFNLFFQRSYSTQGFKASYNFNSPFQLRNNVANLQEDIFLILRFCHPIMQLLFDKICSNVLYILSAMHQPQIFPQLVVDHSFQHHSNQLALQARMSQAENRCKHYYISQTFY